MEKNCFLLLLSLSAQNAAVGKAVMDRIKRNIDPGAAPRWIDAKGVGVFISTDLPAWKIWPTAFPEQLPREEQMLMKDLLIVQVGPGWYAGDAQTTYAAWLNAKFPRT